MRPCEINDIMVSSRQREREETKRETLNCNKILILNIIHIGTIKRRLLGHEYKVLSIDLQIVLKSNVTYAKH